MRDSKLKKVIILGLLTSLAMIINLFESMIPIPIVIPGFKLGLSNIVSLAVLVVFGLKSSLIIAIVRCLLLMIIAGNPVSLIYSIFSALSSVLVMYIALKYFKSYFSLIGVSVLGALTHNTVQVLVASIMINNIDIFVYLPFLTLMSIFTGCFVGYSAYFISDNLKKQTKYLN